MKAARLSILIAGRRHHEHLRLWRLGCRRKRDWRLGQRRHVEHRRHDGTGGRHRHRRHDHRDWRVRHRRPRAPAGYSHTGGAARFACDRHRRRDRRRAAVAHRRSDGDRRHRHRRRGRCPCHGRHRRRRRGGGAAGGTRRHRRRDRHRRKRRRHGSGTCTASKSRRRERVGHRAAQGDRRDQRRLRHQPGDHLPAVRSGRHREVPHLRLGRGRLLARTGSRTRPRWARSPRTATSSSPTDVPNGSASRTMSSRRSLGDGQAAAGVRDLGDRRERQALQRLLPEPWTRPRSAANGFSCGGLMAEGTAGDPRITTWGLNSSGLLSADPTSTQEGPYAGADRAGRHPATSPTRTANATTRPSPATAIPSCCSARQLGHGGDLFSSHGGDFTKIDLAWLNWQLKGDTDRHRQGPADRRRAAPTAATAPGK